MLKATGLTLWLVSNCAYIVRLSNCPPHLTQVFHAGGRQWWCWGGGALTQRKCRTDTYKNVKDSVPSSLQSVLVWCWIHVKNLQGEKKTEASWRECVITRHGDAGRVIQTVREAEAVDVEVQESCWGGSSGEGDPSGESSSQLRVPASFIEFFSTFFTSASLTVYSVLC